MKYEKCFLAITKDGKIFRKETKGRVIPGYPDFLLTKQFKNSQIKITYKLTGMCLPFLDFKTYKVAQEWIDQNEFKMNEFLDAIRKTDLEKFLRKFENAPILEE